MPRRFIYIINPISGTGKKQTLQQLIELKTIEAGFEYEVYPSVASGDYSFLFDVIAEKEITDVVIAGGDGTINAAINSLRHIDVNFGILPCGSGNGLAFSAGIPKNIEKALQIVFEGRSSLTDAFIINDHFACMLCGVGFDAQVAHDFANDPNRGLTTYIKKSVLNFFSAKAYPFVLEVHDNELLINAFFISIANSNQFGNHVTIAPKASLTDGLLDVVIVTKQHKLSLLVQTFKQIAGFNKLQEIDVINDQASVIYFQTDNLNILNKELAPMHIDGDPSHSFEKLEIKMLKHCFKLIYP